MKQKIAGLILAVLDVYKRFLCGGGEMNRKISATIIAMLILAVLSGAIGILPVGKASGFGTTLFFDDFESYPVGTFPSTGGWELVWSGTGQNYVSDVYSFSPTKSLQLWGLPSWSSVAQRKFSTDAPVIGYEFAICIDSIGTGGPGRVEHPGFFSREAYIWGAYYAIVFFNHDNGKIWAEDDTILGEWEPGVWYKVKVVLDRSTNTYNVWIDGELRGEGLSTTRSDTDLIDALALISDHAGVKVYYDDVRVFVRPQSLFIDIDIKPGSYPNSFNNNGNGVIPVAILGSQYLDVTAIDAGSVSLEGMAIRAVGKSNKLLSHYEDVNGDSILDLVVQIEDTDGTFTLGDTTATLTGTLMDGTLIEGQDSIRIVP